MKKLVVAALLAVISAACSSEPKAEPAPAAPAAAPVAPAAPVEPAAPAAPVPTPTAAAPTGAADPKAEADTIFAQRCVMCHGANGLGDGPAAAALNPKPRAYGDAAWQASVTDEHIAKVILEGGAAVGKSAAMPGQADLKDKPEVLKAIVAKIRAYAPPAAK